MPSSLLAFTLPITPKPMPRPRVSSAGGVFYPADYKKWEKELDALLVDRLTPISAARDDPDPIFSVYVESVCPPLKTVVRRSPMGDVDNLAKAIFDRITRTGKVWADDRAITLMHSGKRFAKAGEAPHYTVRIQYEDS